MGTNRVKNYFNNQLDDGPSLLMRVQITHPEGFGFLDTRPDGVKSLAWHVESGSIVTIPRACAESLVRAGYARISP